MFIPLFVSVVSFAALQQQTRLRCCFGSKSHFEQFDLWPFILVPCGIFTEIAPHLIHFCCSSVVLLQVWLLSTHLVTTEQNRVCVTLILVLVLVLLLVHQRSEQHDLEVSWPPGKINTSSLLLSSFLLFFLPAAAVVRLSNYITEPLVASLTCKRCGRVFFVISIFLSQTFISWHENTVAGAIPQLWV